MNLKTVIGIVLLLLSVGTGFYSNSFKDETKEVMVPAKELPAKLAPTTRGNDLANAVCQESNGWNICPPVPGADMPDFFRNYKPVTGLAIGSYRTGEACQPFENTRICVGTIRGVEVNLANAGLEELERQNLRVRSDSQLHLAVTDWVKQLQKGGLDPNKAVGRTISPPICHAGECRQYFDKVMVKFPEGATSGDEVHPVPVERNRLYPAPPPEIEPAHLVQRPLPWNRNFPLLGWGAVTVCLLAAGIAIMIYGRLEDDY